MKRYSVDKLRGIYAKHIKWLMNEPGGERADLRGAYLQDAYLQDADLRGAYLQGAYLQGAYLQGADLQRADLRGADLRGAYLQGAYLQGADLQDADLQGAYLQGADLRGAKNAETAFAMTMTPSQGSVIGWKKAKAPSGGTCIVKLRIPEEAKRSSATGRKCRAEWAEVLMVYGAEYGNSSRDANIEYRVGQIVRPDSWDDDRWEECSHGIHFFITREEAEDWSL